MIKIGDFARLAQVSVVTLRHYDEIGLLRPIMVDRYTGYRYYSVTQLPRLNRILALKDLGFTLGQIETVLGGLTLEHLRGMLQLRHAEVEQHIVDEQSRLARIADRLRQIESEDTMATPDVVVKTLPAQLIVSRLITVPTNDQVPQYLDNAYMEVYNYLNEQGGKDTGPCFGIWHQPAEIYADEQVEAAVPIEQSFPGSERIKVYELPEQLAATAILYGGYEGLNDLHAALLSWVESNGYRSMGIYREIYFQNKTIDPAKPTVEIQYPVEQA